VTTTKASGGGKIRGASCAKAEVATIDEVAVGEAEKWGDQDGVQVSPSVTALETEQARATRWGVAGLEEFCNRALSQRLRNGGTCCLDLPGDSVSRHWDKRGAGRQSKGRSCPQAHWHSAYIAHTEQHRNTFQHFTEFIFTEGLALQQTRKW
jgi:hypothetical protein